ncbi:hypothetical protein O7622_01155 [Micromonospora sp. WMMD1076]|uniref:hypothetical protein n=1 Tax=Micromonospora sp. WMMD1076 TaxID=3016103 RepID=UPI00249C285C|nr:hypothetical protein [Micromonospora sp. WMMD1076]WFF07238.1 hypothetical protein O7622_01155 [Micromonospora sp. WMMD1076]
MAKPTHQDQTTPRPRGQAMVGARRRVVCPETGVVHMLHAAWADRVVSMHGGML